MENKRSPLKITAAIIAAILLVYTLLALLPRPVNYSGENVLMKDGDTPILVVHGGGNGEFPDNTLEAFYNAYDADKNVMMEIDVSITKDGVVILSHDTSIDRCSNSTGLISELNYSELIANEVDFGYENEMADGVRVGEPKHYVGEDGTEKYPTDVPYPDSVSPRHESVFLATTLEELILAFPDNRISVEIKQEGALGKKCLYAVLDLIGKHDAFEVVRRSVSIDAPPPRVYTWCGESDHLMDCNGEFDELLTQLGIEHLYEHSEGDHTWKWWDLHIKDALKYLFG